MLVQFKLPDEDNQLRLTRHGQAGLAARVTEALREYVSKMPDGTKLVPEPALAGELGVSRTTLRAALAVLASEGLIERAPKRGTIIRRPAGTRPANIGVISPKAGWEHSGTFYNDVYRGITAAAAHHAADVTHLLGSLGRDITPRAIRGLTWERFDALVVFELFDEQCAEIFQQRAPNVVYLDYDATAYGITSVVYDNFAAAAAMTEALMDMGHRRFGFVGPRMGGRPWGDPAYVERLRGVMDAVARRSGVFLAQHILTAERRTLKEALAPLLEAPREQRPTAIVAADGGYAALLREAHEDGLLKVPEELSVAIFGTLGSEAMEEWGGAYFSGVQMGYRGVEALYQQIRGDGKAGELLREGFTLHMQHSVAPPAR